MSDRKNALKIAVANYIEERGEVTSTRDIIEAVKSTVGFEPSTATVAEVLRELGYTPKRAPIAFWGKAAK